MPRSRARGPACWRAAAQRALASQGWPDGWRLVGCAWASTRGSRRERRRVHRPRRSSLREDLLRRPRRSGARLAGDPARRRRRGAGGPRRTRPRGHELKDLPASERLYQLTGPGLLSDSPPLHTATGRRDLQPDAPAAGQQLGRSILVAPRSADATNGLVALVELLARSASPHELILAARGGGEGRDAAGDRRQSST